AAARMDAADELGHAEATDAVIRALAHCLGTDPFYGVRQECATALGRLRGHAAAQALATALAGDKDARVRRSAADALGNFLARCEPGAAEALGRALTKEPKVTVRRAIAEGLGATRAPAAFDALTLALKTSSFHDNVRQGALFGLLSLRDARAL